MEIICNTTELLFLPGQPGIILGFLLNGRRKVLSFLFFSFLFLFSSSCLLQVPQLAPTGVSKQFMESIVQVRHKLHFPQYLKYNTCMIETLALRDRDRCMTGSKLYVLGAY